MPLKADQRAMLQLLLERDQSYDDIASVLGGERDEVRERARAALAELGGSDPDADVELTDYLLGQADPIGRADAVRHLQSDPETLGLAEKIAAQLQLLAPDAELPQLPRSKKGGRPAAAAADGDGRGKPSSTAPGRARLAPRAESIATPLRRRFTEHRQQSLIILGVLAAVLVVGILALTGVIGGGDDEPTAAAEPATPLLGYPLAPLEPDKNGEATGVIPLEQIALTLLAQVAATEGFVDVSLTSNDALAPAIQTALEQGSPVIEFDGTSVLRGSFADVQPGEQGSDKALTLDLEPADGDASGTVTVGAQDKKPFIDLDISGLETPPEGQTYVLWFLLPEGTELPAPSDAPQGAVPPQGGGGGGGGGGGAPDEPAQP